MAKSIQIDFVTRLRDEKRFVSIDELVGQLHQDVHLARTILMD